MSSSPPNHPDSKSSSEILNELFSTFNSSFNEQASSSSSKKQKKKKKKRSKSQDSDGDDSSVESQLKKARKLEKLDKIALKKTKKKKKPDAVEVKDKVKPERKLKRKSTASSSSHSSSALKGSLSSSPQKKIKSTSKKIKSKSSLKSLGLGYSGSSEDKQIIGDGFVILNKGSSKKKTLDKSKKDFDLEDGEIDDVAEAKAEKKIKKKKHKSDPFANLTITPSSTKRLKLSASQAYKLDAEEKLLLGYGSSNNGNSHHDGYNDSRYDHSDHYRASSSKSSNSHRGSYDHHRGDRSGGDDRSRDRERDHHDRRRSRSRSPSGSSSSSSSRPRLAPPRDAYKSSYLKFQKSHESSSYDDRASHHSSQSRYDSTSYYDYHAERGRESYSSSKGGFGYVGKSYYYDDVEEDQRDRERDRDRDRDNRDRGRDDRDRDYGSRAWRHRHRSRSPTLRRSYYHPDDIIDKTELLEIARKNAKKLMQSGVLPSDIFSRDQILAIKAGGKNVEELTNYCKRLAKRDAMGDARGSDDSGDEGGGRSFIHHPFQVKDKPLPTITLNIRNSVPLPVRTPQELAIESAKLRTQFPVSSGCQHRFKELEWKPVSEDDKEEKEGSSTAIVALSSASTSSATGPNVCSVAPMIKETIEESAAITTASADDADKEKKNDSPKIGDEEDKIEETKSKTGELKAIEAGPSSKSKDNSAISVDGPDLPLVDIGSVIGLRLKAMRMLQENPTSGDAQRQLDEATQMMKHWADAKALEPKFLTVAELSSGPQAWAKKDQLRKTRALDSGMGMHLLQKMGWRPGEGLGKNKEGQLEPLALDVKTDKKGLTAAVEEIMYGKNSGSGSSGGGPSMPQVYDLSAKHPVSALMELTAKRRWGNPEFELCFEHGPPHKRQFVYKVIVNGVEYQPCIAVGNKKQAKANAAAFCLQSLGLLPTTASPSNSSELLQTVEPSATAVSEPENPLKQTFKNASSFLQTVHSDNELMPPPPPPVPPPPMPPSLMNFSVSK